MKLIFHFSCTHVTSSLYLCPLMKKLFAIFLVALFLFNTVGYYFVFSYNQYTIRKEIHCLIRTRYFEGSCIMLQISTPLLNSDFKWLETGEFRYKGVLYDVISEKSVGQITTFHCINDKQEEKLIAGLSHSQEFAFGQNNPARTKHATAMLYHVIKLALVENRWNYSPQVPMEISFFNPINLLSSVLRPPISPPPRLV